MPPKRKHAEGASTDTAPARTTRQSTRQATTEVATSSKKSVAKPKTTKSKTTKVQPGSESEAEEPPAKKSKSKVATTVKAKMKKNTNLDDVNDVEARRNDTSSKTPSTKETTIPNKQPATKVKAEPYSASRATALFEQFADKDDPSVIGPVGFEKLCNEAQIPVDGALPMILSWQLNSKEMLKLDKEGWEQGTSTLKISTLPLMNIMVNELQDLLVLGKPPIKRPPAGGPYSRTQYWDYAVDCKAAFRAFYTYCFNLVKPPESRNIDMETATAFWNVLLPEKYPLVSEIFEYIQENASSYKAANKDLWAMMLEFLDTVDPSLTDYDASEGAWPTLLDGFVEWKRAKEENGSS